MRRRDFIKAVGVGAATLALPRLVHADGAKNTKPNIVLCMADDQGWGDMGYNGHRALKTPNFDAMAAETLRFDRFYAAAPVCSPTRGSVMTGRHPNRFGCFQWGHSLRPQEITLAESLKAAGYTTGHFGKWHLGSVRKGSPVNPGASGFDQWISAENYFDNDPVLSDRGRAVQFKGESSMVTANAAIDFIRQQAKSAKPFLAVVWFGSPHLPHRAVPEDRRGYGRSHTANFYGEITGMDRAFGKLRKELATLGIAENTLLWYCSDNGGLNRLGSTGGRGHKGQIYEGGLRVPALLEWPQRFKGARKTHVPCNTTDILPTVLAAAGVDVPADRPIDGINLLPLINGKMESRAKAMGFWSYPSGGKGMHSDKMMAEVLAAQATGKEPEDTALLRLEAAKITKQYPFNDFPGHAAWLDWPWKLHRKGTSQELYNLATDWGERKNLAAAEPARVKKMLAELTAWQNSVIRSLNGKDYG